MAKTILSEDSTIKVNLSNESIIGVNVSVDDTNYIPGYKEAEAQRRKNEEQRITNELERIANEKERENYFEDMQQKVESGYFNGEPGPEGPRGPKGPPGEPGYTPIKGVDYFDGQDAPKYIAGTNIEITEDNVINCTATGGGGGTLTEELDPTVPDYVKNITEADIEKWNSGTGFDGDYNNLTNKPTELSQFNNDVGYITNDEETDPTVPQHVKNITEADIEKWNNGTGGGTLTEETDPTVPSYVKNITEANINSWNGKAEKSEIPTKTSQLTNDSGFKTTDSNTTYTLSKTGSTVKLTGSDGSSSSITVTEGGGATYSEATTTKSGLMSASDKSKLDGISAGANKTTVDSALSSSSTNPVQNKVVNTALGNKQNKVLSGTGEPNNSLGANGDIYFDLKGGDNEIYSEAETVAGTWLGKPLYRRVINFGRLPNANEQSRTVAHNISNIDTIINVRGMAYNTSGTAILLPFLSAVADNMIIITFNKTSIIISAVIDRSAFNGIVVMEYTKTTD